MVMETDGEILINADPTNTDIVSTFKSRNFLLRSKVEFICWCKNIREERNKETWQEKWLRNSNKLWLKIPLARSLHENQVSTLTESTFYRPADEAQKLVA